VRYLGHWPELLNDLGLLGRVWVETTAPGVRVSQRQCLAGLRVQGLVGHLDSAGYQLRVLLDDCHAMRALKGDQGLVLEDGSGAPVATIRRDQSSHPLALQVLLSSLGAQDRSVVPAPHRRQEAPIAALEQHAVGRLQRDCQTLGPDLGFREVAELSGRLSLQPEQLRQMAAEAGAEAVAVDPSLVPCALETLADQVYPLALSSGSRGWVSRAVQSVYGHAYVDGQLALRGDAVRLELDVRAIDSAWVVGRRSGERDERSLRLYDADGRAIAVIASGADPWSCGRRDDGGARVSAGRPHGQWRPDAIRLWTTLMNALTS
jgi:putative heme degradation protein